MTEYKLLVSDDAPAESLPVHRFGGRPLVAIGSKVVWPNCKECKLPMLFIGQIMVSAQDSSSQNLILIFKCDRESICSSWMPDKGCNQVIVVPVSPNMTLMEPPSADGCLHSITYGAMVADSSGEDIYDAMKNYVEKANSTFDKILGYIYGEPDWIQNDETPKCKKCKKPMRFVANLNEGPDPMQTFNFGTGEAYLFDCKCGAGKFLWQC